MNTQKMDRLISDLLNLSRIGKNGLVISRIDMTALVRSIYHEIASPEIQQKFTFLLKSLPDSYGDSNLLRQVWTNLISNAIKFTLPKRRRSIEIGCHVENGANIYYVKDNGVGFNPE